MRSNRGGGSCVQLAGARVARYVIESYPKVTGQTLAMKMEQFRWRVPLPPDQVESYIDTLGRGFPPFS